MWEARREAAGSSRHSGRHSGMTSVAQQLTCSLSYSLPLYRLEAEAQKAGPLKCVCGGRQVAGGAAKNYFPPLSRCFRAWQRFVQRGARYRRQLAHRRARTLRTCLGQWVEMKQLQASDVAKVTQLALCRQKAGEPAANTGRPSPPIRAPINPVKPRKYYRGRGLC